MAKNITKYLLIYFLFLPFNPLQAQTTRSGEVGLQIGGNYYLGDLNHMPFKNTKLAGGAFYRHNINPRLSAKGLMYVGYLSGSGRIPNGIDQSFNKFYGQLNAIGEFNFIPFVVDKKNTKYSPYLQAGVGLLYYPNKDGRIFLFDIPMGFGFKMNITNRFILGADYLMYKTFADHIDYMGSPISSEGIEHQNYYKGNKDWISYFGIYLAYKIEYSEKCPAFD